MSVVNRTLHVVIDSGGSGDKCVRPSPAARQDSQSTTVRKRLQARAIPSMQLYLNICRLLT
jgi:hypothetical protein